MRRLILGILVLVAVLQSNAQKAETVHYKFSGGLKAGMNYSRLRFGDNVPNTFENKWKTGFAGGLWFNFPVARSFSIQPEILYSEMGGTVNGPFTGYNRYMTIEQRTSYLSIPVLLKAHLGKSVAIYAGPQFDARLKSSWDRSNGYGVSDNSDSVRNTDFAVVGGVQFFPRSRFFIDLRYIHGLQDVWYKKDGAYFNQAIQATIGLRLFGKPVAIAAPVVAVPVYVPPVDTDGDGIADKDDKCPTVAGVAKYNGCPIPDTDGDGINDDNDKCPTVAGTAKYQGCPIPDTDGDGINDEEDKCPTVAGLARYQGCPIPDTDGDGINDEEDECKNTVGLANNYGCPEMVFYYKKADAVLAASDKAELDKLVAWMNRHPDRKISIEGHTSTPGTTVYNQKLSEKRAQNCVKYVVSKGIDKNRLKAVGYGEQFPIGDNSKEEGRAQSRRVVMRIAD